MDQKQSESKKKQSWFQFLFLNNQIVVSLLIVLLILINLFLITKLGHLFWPIGDFLNIIALPVIASGILYYLFAPLVDYCEKLNVPRPLTIMGIFIVLILLVIWGVVSLNPIIQRQSAAFLMNLPIYYNTIIRTITNSKYITDNPNLQATVAPIIENFDFNSLTQRLNELVSDTFGGLGSFVGTVTQVVTGLLAIPIILYYLLLNSNDIPKIILYHVPNKYRPVMSRMMYRGNYQISQYIRGQILVGIFVGIIFAIEYSIINLDYGTTLAVMAGLFNIIPYVGSVIAFIPALIIGLLTSPSMAIKVVLALLIEQTLEGRFIAPQVLGNNMKIHPVTILLVLLTGGKLFGLTGIILGVPGYAIVKVIVTEFYHWYRENSDLYQEDEVEPIIINHKIQFDAEHVVETNTINNNTIPKSEEKEDSL